MAETNRRQFFYKINRPGPSKKTNSTNAKGSNQSTVFLNFFFLRKVFLNLFTSLCIKSSASCSSGHQTEKKFHLLALEKIHKAQTRSKELIPNSR
jgi:hypothetical protein